MATTIEAYRVEADQLYEQYRSLSLAVRTILFWSRAAPMEMIWRA